MTPFGFNSGLFTAPRFIVSLVEIKKKKKKKKRGRRDKKGKKGRRNKKKRRKERKKELKEKKKKAPCWLQTVPSSSAGLPGYSRLRGNWFCFLPFLSNTCPASSPVPQFTAGPPVPFCTQPRPLVHQLHTPWGAPFRGISHTTFSFFAVLDSRDSQRPFRLVQPPPPTELSLSGDG